MGLRGLFSEPSFRRMSNDKTNEPRIFQAGDRVRAPDNYNGRWHRGTYLGLPLSPGGPVEVEWDHPELARTANMAKLEIIPEDDEQADE